MDDNDKSAPRTDCRFFIGEKPCRFKRLCQGCEHYAPRGTRILVIKLAAVGDVLRTTPILAALREVHSPSHVTWLTDASSAELLRYTEGIDVLLRYSTASVVQLLSLIHI